MQGARLAGSGWGRDRVSAFSAGGELGGRHGISYCGTSAAKRSADRSGRDQPSTEAGRNGDLRNSQSIQPASEHGELLPGSYTSKPSSESADEIPDGGARPV